jgi:hypothetical protein
MCLEPIQTLWVGPMNELVYACLTSFVSVGHPVHLYSYGDILDAPLGVRIFSADDIVSEKILQRNVKGEGRGSYAAFSDLFRLSLLYKLGGWWVDTDVYCMRPFVANNSYVFAAEHDSVGTCVIHAPASSDILGEALEKMRSIPIKNVSWTEYKDIYAESVFNSGFSGLIQSSDVFCPIPWNKIVSFVHDNYAPHLSKSNLGIHLWHEIWRRNDLYSYVNRYTKLLSQTKPKH